MSMVHPHIRIEARGGHVRVTYAETLPPREPDPTSTAPPPPPEIIYVCEYANPPGWLMRLFGDTLERRIARAQVKVMRKGQRQVVRYQRAHQAVTGGSNR